MYRTKDITHILLMRCICLNFSNYYLITPSTADMIYTVKDNSRLAITSIDEKLKLRPVIYITKNINLVGNGSIEDPLTIG